MKIKDPLGGWPTPCRPTIVGQGYLFDYWSSQWEHLFKCPKLFQLLIFLLVSLHHDYYYMFFLGNVVHRCKNIKSLKSQ
jgi:hypothetical protein